MNILIAVLVAQLGADDFRTRERAHHALQDAMPAAMLQLEIAERSADKERACRARQILDGWYAEYARAMARRTLPSSYPRMPWLAELPGQPEGLAAHYLEVARSRIGMQGPPWNDYSLATRLMVEDMYRRRVPRPEIVKVLDEMVDAERRWVAEYGGRFYPAVKLADLPR